MFRHAFRIGLIAAVLATTFALDARLIAQGARGNARGSGAPSPIDPFLGTWRLDRAKSTFPGAVPEWRTHKFEKVATGVKHTTQSMIGEVVGTLQYTFQFDGKDYPADAAMAVNTVAFKQVDATTLERTGKYQGMVTETVTYRVSPDGKVLTVTQNILANDTSSVQIFNKE
jgi:hypothetical protein